jgi:RNA polymerase sigma factor (sigma-70 family)
VVKREEQAEYEWLFRAAYPSVLRSVYLIMRDRGRAEEVCQDAFIQLHERWSTVSDYERPEAWVRKVAVRMAVRQAGRDRKRAVLERATPPPAPPAPTSDPELADALAELTHMQRAAVVLYYYEDRPVLEVARLLQVSTSTVKQHLHRARARLAQSLGEGVEEDVR